MPDRIAITRITIGEEKARRDIEPNQRFTVTAAQAAELDAYDPPICRDPRAPSPQAGAAEEQGADAVRRVAEPDPGPAVSNGNTTRAKPADDEL